MRAAQKITKKNESDDRGPLCLSPVFDCDRAATALSDLLREARGILDDIEDAYSRGREARPTERAKREILRALAASNGGVEIHDLQISGETGVTGVRSLARAMVEEGLLSMDRDETYPNMVSLRITSDGREELRRLEVKEAMVWLHGRDTELARGMENAKSALSRLVEAVTL